MEKINKMLEWEVTLYDYEKAKCTLADKVNMAKFLRGLDFTGVEEMVEELIHDFFVVVCYIQEEDLWKFIPKVLERVRNADSQKRKAVFSALAVHHNRHLVEDTDESAGVKKFIELLPELLGLSDEQLMTTQDRYQGSEEELLDIYLDIIER